MELLLVIVALLAGALLPVQAGVNAEMGRHAGRPEWAAFVSFAVGLVALGAWLLVRQVAPPSGAALARAPAWAWIGGALGAFYVTAVILLTPRLGVATTLAVSVAGQLGAALVLDHLGLLGLAERPVTPLRLAGAALLVIAVLLMRR